MALVPGAAPLLESSLQATWQMERTRLQADLKGVDAIVTLARGAVPTQNGHRSPGFFDTSHVTPSGGGMLDGAQRAPAVRMMLDLGVLPLSVPVIVLGADDKKTKIHWSHMIKQELEAAGVEQERIHISDIADKAVQPNTGGEITELFQIIQRQHLHHVALLAGRTQLPRLQSIISLFEHLNPAPSRYSQERAADLRDSLLYHPLFTRLREEEGFYDRLLKHLERAQKKEPTSARDKELERKRLHGVYVLAQNPYKYFGTISTESLHDAAQAFVHNYHNRFSTSDRIIDLQTYLTPDILSAVDQAQITFQTAEEHFQASPHVGLQRLASLNTNSLTAARTLVNELWGAAEMLSPELGYTYYTGKVPEL